MSRISRRRRAARQLAPRSHKKAMSIAIAVLLVLVLVAVLLLTQLDLGRQRKHAKTPSSSVTTTPTTAPPSTTTSEPRPAQQYTVREGDTLSSIARRFHVTTGAIVIASKLSNPDRLTIGQTLTIPAEVPVRLVLQPARIPPGGSTSFTLTGATPGEKVTFEVQTPSGSFEGPAHVAEPDGRVTTTYSANATDPAASYLVVARGDQGTTATAVLVVRPAPAR